ncbi:MAG: OmpA family protein [Ignavibacteria bacterium]|jgi:outer membrane protein OmpA-like peptidoglycan-associated protein
MRYIFVTLVGIFYSLCAFAQNQKSQVKKFEFGLYTGVNYNFHAPDFTTKDSTGKTIGNYKLSSTSMGFHGGGFVDYSLNKTFRLTGRLGIHGMGAELIEELSNNTLNTLTANITMLEISTGVKFMDLFNDNPAYVLAGFEYGSRLTSEYSENLASNQVSSTAYSTIPGTNDRLALYVGAGIPMKAWNYTITPEVTYRKSLGDFSSDLSPWGLDQLRLGVSITLGPSSKKSEPKDPIITNAAKVEVGYYDDAGDYRILESGLTVEDIQYSEMYPFVPFVFFGLNSEKPDPSLQMTNSGDARGQFSLETLPQDAIEINKRTMDIIGLRMRGNPDATLSLIGSIDGKAESKKGLALRRAENVKSYLTSNYGIDANRIATTSKVLPDVPTAKNLKDGMSENRRVTFKSSHFDILEPITIRGDESRWTKPELIEFRPKDFDSTAINTWTLNISQAGRSLKDLAGAGTPTPQRWVIRPNELSNSQVPIDYTLSTVNNNGTTSAVNGSIPVDYSSSIKQSVESKPDMVVTKFSLILFDFDRAEISPENAEILKNRVGPVIKGNSIVKIIGYTDRIGAPDYNRSLALQRADATKSILEEKSPDAKYEVAGRGEDVEIFDNGIPTGRVLSRTVQIFVETPRK